MGQLSLFPDGTFEKVMAAHAFLELEKIKVKLKKANNSLRTFKGHSTKRKNNGK